MNTGCTHRQSWSSMELPGYPLLHPTTPSAGFRHHAQAYKVRVALLATITILHVQCHQDKTTSDPNSLSLPAHLNIFADYRTHQAFIGFSSLPPNTITILYSSSPGTQWEQSHFQDDYTGLSGILHAKYAGLLPQ